MSDLEKAARMALEALGYYEVAGLATTRVAKAITALRQALSNSVEQPAQQEPWVGLTDEEIGDIEITWEATQEWACFRYAARAIEAKLKEKNT